MPFFSRGPAAPTLYRSGKRSSIRAAGGEASYHGQCLSRLSRGAQAHSGRRGPRHHPGRKTARKSDGLSPVGRDLRSFIDRGGNPGCEGQGRIKTSHSFWQTRAGVTAQSAQGPGGIIHATKAMFKRLASQGRAVLTPTLRHQGVDYGALRLLIGNLQAARSLYVGALRITDAHTCSTSGAEMHHKASNTCSRGEVSTLKSARQRFRSS
jgi:hypothetical protein